MSERQARVGIVAGEASGDRLGASFIRAMRSEIPSVRFEGVAGPEMVAAGCRPIAHIDQLSVMGLVEIISRYPELRRLRNNLTKHFISNPPDVFVGIDVPDFNFGIEKRLKRHGVPTVHFVCPQAWAWRPGRARSIGTMVDLLLAVFPFEPMFFSRYGADAKFVGHPLADVLPLSPDAGAARENLGLPGDGLVVAILPGSRRQEIDRLLEPFVGAADMFYQSHRQARFVLCVARQSQIEGVQRYVAENFGHLPCEIVHGAAHQVLSAADIAIVASGTASLEALLCRTPMVVCYRMAFPTYHIISRMVTIPHIAIPNILAGRELVPELIQNEVTPEAICQQMHFWLEDSERRSGFLDVSVSLHKELRRDAAKNAARAVYRLLK